MLPLLRQSYSFPRCRLGFDPLQGRIFNKGFLPETRRDGGAEPQSLVSITNKPVLNLKYLRSEYDVKAYVGPTVDRDSSVGWER